MPPVRFVQIIKQQRRDETRRGKRRVESRWMDAKVGSGGALCIGRDGVGVERSRRKGGTSDFACESPVVDVLLDDGWR